MPDEDDDKTEQSMHMEEVRSGEHGFAVDEEPEASAPSSDESEDDAA